VGARIRAARQALALNQDDFAAMAGLHRAYVGHLENGTKDLRITTLIKVAAALGIAPGELLPREVPEDLEGVN